MAVEPTVGCICLRFEAAKHRTWLALWRCGPVCSHVSLRAPPGVRGRTIAHGGLARRTAGNDCTRQPACCPEFGNSTAGYANGSSPTPLPADEPITMAFAPRIAGSVRPSSRLYRSSSQCGAAAMRVSQQETHRRVARISRIVAAIALCSVAMPSIASGLVQTPPPLWVSATALSLTLVTAAVRPKN